MTTICAISDTHNRSKYPILMEGIAADILIHAGDLTGHGYCWQLRQAFETLREFKNFKHKIVIAGNHDFCLAELHKDKLQEFLDEFPDITYLKDSSVNIEGIKFYGNPYTPVFGNWAFMKNRGKSIAEEWAKIPEDVDVLITHGPPWGKLDKVIAGINTGLSVGCEELTKVVERIKPKYHVFGHVHEGYGTYVDYDNNITYINAALVNQGYKPVNKPIVWEY